MKTKLYFSLIVLMLSGCTFMNTLAMDRNQAQENSWFPSLIAATVQRCSNEPKIAYLKAEAAEAVRYIRSIGIINLSKDEAIELLSRYSHIMTQLDELGQGDCLLQMIIWQLNSHIEVPLRQGEAQPPIEERPGVRDYLLKSFIKYKELCVASFR